MIKDIEMMKSFRLKNILLIACAAFVFTACSSKQKKSITNQHFIGTTK
jgi:uncharacterized lipoprotein YajG